MEMTNRRKIHWATHCSLRLGSTRTIGGRKNEKKVNL